MENRDFAHLHLHTDASLRDGLGTVPRLLSRAKSMGFRQVAMTDHGTLANAVTFSIEAGHLGLKPLIGLEGYVEFDGTIGHITLLADGMEGWNSLLKLNNSAHESGYRQPAFLIDDLVKNQKGLLCLTGCIASPFQQLPLMEAYRLGAKLKGVFGHRLFAELMFVGDSIAWERPLRLASKLGLKKVITNDVHFPLKGDGRIHPVLTKMKAGFDYDSTQLWLKSADEIFASASRYDLKEGDIKRMMGRTAKIAEMLGGVDLSSKPKLPTVKSKRGLGYLATTGKRCGLLVEAPYWERYNKEIDIIEKTGYADYFIILNDIVSKAREKGIKVGPGRGSGAGSLILYLLGITDVDPIEYGLNFERFLNPERKGMPDVDVDIESERREEVLGYAKEKYSAIPIATYSRYSHKSLTRDLGKMYRVDKELINKAADKGESSDEFIKITKDFPGFLQSYEAFMGQIRHKGKHAGGVIITETPVPIERVGSGLAAAWTEGIKNELSYAGIVKFDLLGLTVLSALRRLEEKTGHKPPSASDFAPEFGLFRDGDLAGIFQFSGSDGIRQLTIEMQPTTFKDLIAINALYRPGAIDAGSTARYPHWKKHPRKVAGYIADILEETYGAVVYQEQFMEIYARTVGGSFGEADSARAVITKAKPDDPIWLKKLSELKDKFIEGAMVNHGLLRVEAKKLWQELETHSNYSFNKSHSTAYAKISWECAWWKFNFPTEFFAAMLNVDPQEEQTYIVDAVKAGIEILPPHVNKSSSEWEASGTREISMPLSAIKFLGKSGVDSLLAVRPASGFKDIEAFMKVVPKKLVRANARAGLFALKGFKGLWESFENPEVLKILGFKTLPKLGTKRERQLRYLGVIIPDKKMLDQFESLEADGWRCGIIKSMDARESAWGAYKVYRLTPSGVFWSREVMDLEKGEIVAVKISSRNGKAKTIKIL